MKYIIKLLLVISLLAGSSIFASASLDKDQADKDDNGSDRSTCCNYGTKLICSTSPPCVECGESCYGGVTVCVEVEDTSGGDNESRASFIDNWTFNYIHSSADVKLESNGGGCSSCGSDGPSTNIPRVHLNRIHRFRNTTEQSSFGPGIFSSWDITLKLFKDDKGRNRVDLSDPSDLNTRRLFPQNGKFFDTFARAVNGLTLFKDGGATTTDVNLAVRAELLTRDKRVFKFDIFDFEGAKAGRLTEIVNRNGYAMTVAYEVLVNDTNADESQKWKMASISDETGRVISFTYLPEQRNSMWVIGTILMPNGNSINYNYNPVQDINNPDSDERLISVDFPDGTQSTFTRTVTDSGKTKVSIFEAGQEGFDRNKSAYLSSNIGAHRAMDGLEYFNSASLLIAYATKGQVNEEVAYYGKQDGHVMHRKIYEGEGKLKWTDIDVARFYENWTFTEENGFSGSKEATYNHGEWKFYAGNRQGSPPVMYNKKGVKTQLAYNADNAKKRRTYPDGTFEAWEHNEFLQKTRYRDRLGRVTHYTYDDRGNMLTRTVGLKAQAVNNNNERISGLAYKLYAGVWNKLPNFNNLAPYDFGVISTPELNEVNRSDKFAALYEGDIEITTGGDYTFWTASDDGSKLYIDGNLVVDNDGLHGLKEVQSLQVTLDPGHHTFRLEFFEKGGNQKLFARYSGPDTFDAGSGVEEKIDIPAFVYSHIATGVVEEDVTTSATATYEWTYYPEGHDHQFLLKDEIDANDNKTTYVYNDDHLLAFVYEPDDDYQISGGQHIAKSFTYDYAKRLKTASDAITRTTEFFYDSRNRTEKIVYNDDSTELFFYGTGADANLLVKKKDRNGNTKLFDYDEKGRIETKITAYSTMAAEGTNETLNTAALQSVSTYTYLNGAETVRTATVDGELTEYFYDYRRRLIETRRHADNDSVLITKSHFYRNQLLFTEDPYGRRTYNSYRSSDSQLIRSVQETMSGAVSASSFNHVNNLSRDLANNAAYLITDYEKDVEGQATATIDPRGILHEIDYDCRGRARLQIRAVGSFDQITETLFDANSNVIEVRNPRYFSEVIDDRTTMTYTSRNLLESRTVAAGSAIEATEHFTYYDDGRAKDHTDFRGNTSSTIWHNCCGRLQANIDQDGNFVVSNNDYAGNVTHTVVVDKAAGNSFDFHNPPTEHTLQEITTQYDARHRPIARTVWLTALSDEVLPNEVPIAGSAGVSPALGLTTRYEYFDDLSDSQLTEIIAELAADGILLGAPHADAAQGSATIITNPEGEKSVSIRDGVGRVVASGMLSKIDGSLVTWSTVTHDNLVNGLLETIQTSALGYKNSVRTDGAGRRIEAEDADRNNPDHPGVGNISRFEYDANSNLVSFRDPNGVGQDCDFDDLNRDTSCEDTEGAIVSKTFDFNNNIITQTDAKLNTKTCYFDERNRQEFCLDRINGTTSYTYDDNNNVKTITDALSKETKYDYDVRNLQVKVIYPDHVQNAAIGTDGYGISECTYDALGRKLTSTDQKGEKVEYLYDLASRITDRIYYFADDTEESRDEFTFDYASRVLTASKGRYGNIISFFYDEIGRRETETTTIPGSAGVSPASFTTTYGYDADSRLTDCEYPAGNNIAKDFTERNQLESINFNAADILESEFDAGGREETRTFANGLVTTNTFNLDNTLDSKSVSGSSGILPELSFSYTYDANKNVESETAGGVLSNYSWNASFDDIDRVTSWSRTGAANTLPASQTWNLDKIGNWNSVITDGSLESRNHNDVHEMTSIGGKDIDYDVKGNLTSKPLTSLVNATLTWDIDNHLVTYNDGTDTTSFEYDALGRRLIKSKGLDSTLFISSGNQVIEEYEYQTNQAPALARSYVYASYIDDVVAKVENNAGTPSILYYHSDRQFNVRGLSDASGNVVELYAYSPYGKQIVLDNSGTDIGSSVQSNTYGYTGRRLDSETGLWYFRARYFDDELGRFISRDPLSYVDGMSLYNAYFSQGLMLDPYGLTVKSSVNWKRTYGFYRQTGTIINGKFSPTGTYNLISSNWQGLNISYSEEEKVKGPLKYFDKKNNKAALPQGTEYNVKLGRNVFIQFWKKEDESILQAMTDPNFDDHDVANLSEKRCVEVLGYAIPVKLGDMGMKFPGVSISTPGSMKTTHELNSLKFGFGPVTITMPFPEGEPKGNKIKDEIPDLYIVLLIAADGRNAQVVTPTMHMKKSLGPRLPQNYVEVWDEINGGTSKVDLVNKKYHRTVESLMQKKFKDIYIHENAK